MYSSIDHDAGSENVVDNGGGIAGRRVVLENACATEVLLPTKSLFSCSPSIAGSTFWLSSIPSFPRLFSPCAFF